MPGPSNPTGGTFLRNLRVSWKLALLLLPIFACLAVLAAWTAQTVWARYRAARETESLAFTCVTTGEIVHVLQAERGLTSGFLSGAHDGEALRSHRAQVDRILAAAGPASGGALAGKVNELAAKLAEQRKQVDAHALSAPDAVEVFTREIAALLNDLDLIHAGPEAQALQRLQWAKEAAGQERATGVAGIAAGAFSLPAHARLASLEALQEDRIRQAEALLKGSGAIALEDLRTPASFGELRTLRQSLLEHPGGPWPFGPDAWFKAATARVDLLHGKENALATHLEGTVQAQAQEARWVLGGFLLFLLLSLALSWILVRAVARSLTLPLLGLVTAIRQKDLNLRMDAEGRDEISDLAAAFNGFQGHLAGTVRSIQGASAQVASLANQLVLGAEQTRDATDLVAQGSETQRAAMDQASAAIHQLSASIEQVARTVEAALALAASARTEAARGAGFGRDTAQAMEGIQRATERIVSAVQVIQEIARQTNLLSLNAAIEAAKAGSLGKGFAVVADEVRKLAERSAGAAREIEGLIGQTREIVAAGAEKVGGTSSALERILSEVSTLARQMEEIDVASKEQAKASGDISRQTEDVRTTSEQNAAGAVELAATIQESTRHLAELAQISDHLAKEAAVFRQG